MSLTSRSKKPDKGTNICFYSVAIAVQGQKNMENPAVYAEVFYKHFL